MSIQKLVVSVYTRHSLTCAKYGDPYWRRCRCPKWLYINNNGKRIQRSAKTRNWDRAYEIRRTMDRELEIGVVRTQAIQHGRQQFAKVGSPLKSQEPVTLATAVSRFLAAKKQEKLSGSTVAKLTTIFEQQMLSWSRAHGITNLEEIGVEHLEAFRDTWKDAPLARKKKQERIIGFFYYCLRMSWIRSNPAVLLGRIRVQEKPTDYFTRDEFEKIIDATHVYNPTAWNADTRNMATRVRTLILLMRWSGLSIRDAVRLERSCLSDQNELFLYRAKTGLPVYVPVPDEIAQALRNIPPGPAPNPRYFFWSGNGKLKSAVGNWQRSLRRVFALADLRYEDGAKKRCHPHMFRDTFAVECLLAGVPLEEVSILLGHKSVKITEKHYLPWVKARQEQLQQDIRKAWITGRQQEHTLSM